MTTRSTPIRVTLLLAFGWVFLMNATGGMASRGFEITERKEKAPRPLKIYVLKVDLESPEIELVVAIPDDPDGDGPAESFLMNPAELARKARMHVAVNANPWAMTAATPDGKAPAYVEGGACDVIGLAVAERIASAADAPDAWSLWQDHDGRWQLGVAPAPEAARQAIAGFAPLVSEGQLTTTENNVLHPRTAVGIDEAGKELTIAIVDGRQDGVSEGMSEHELAELMQSLGCWNALNLDGGGSSVLLEHASRTRPKIVNNPSGGSMRPVPVILGLRKVGSTPAAAEKK